MEQTRIDELVAKYNEGLADPSEVQQIELLIEQGHVALTDLRQLEKFNELVMSAKEPVSSLRMDDGFYGMLAKEKKKQVRGEAFMSIFNVNWLMPRLAVAAVILITGFAGGYLFQRPENPEVAQLTDQVRQMQEVILLSLLEKESATERLRAVNLTSEMDQVSQKVTSAIFQTLNNDPNVNVRLAALEALKPYASQGKVREELIRSIAKQDSPLVQMSMAELMAALQEKKSVKEFEKIISDDKTPPEVKNKIKESISILI